MGGGGGGSSVEATLRRNVSNPTHSLKLNGSNAANAASLLLESQRKKQSWDGANGRSLENIDRPWPASQEEVSSSASPKWSPMHSKTISECSTPVNGQSLSVDLSPVEERGGGGPPPLSSNTQTYREYKEALKQQRNQDTTAVYRSKDNTSSSSSSSGGSNQASPMSPVNGVNKSLAADVITIKPKLIMATGTAAAATTGRRSSQEGDDQGEEKSNGLEEENSRNNNNNGGYVKPASPAMGGVEARNGTRSGDSTDSLVIKSIMNGNLRTATNNNSNGTGSGRLGDNNGKTGAAAATAAKNPKRTVSWNRDIVTPEKQTISFTMRREFDRHKEEAELIGKLRNVSGNGEGGGGGGGGGG